MFSLRRIAGAELVQREMLVGVTVIITVPFSCFYTAGVDVGAGEKVVSSRAASLRASHILRMPQITCILVSGVGAWVVQCERALIHPTGGSVRRPDENRARSPAAGVDTHAKDHIHPPSTHSCKFYTSRVAVKRIHTSTPRPWHFWDVGCKKVVVLDTVVHGEKGLVGHGV